MNQSSTISDQDQRLGRNAALASLFVGILLLGAKFWAFRVTGSQAVFSDAMESIVNVAAALASIVVVVIAHRPADRNHPYGHGKVEFFSAAFEGGLVAFAAVLICVEAVQALLSGRSLNQLGIGVGVVLGAGLVNLLLGLFILRAGHRIRSPALVASGQHVISDFWTSAGVTIGLVLVHFTGIDWLDPVVALVVGLLLARTGFGLVRRSVGGLLDAEDVEILKDLQAAIEKERREGIIQVHHVRIMRSGRYHHIDAHVVVPEYWDVARAHAETEAFEARVIAAYPSDGELHLHVDPCRRAYCRNCDQSDCPIRREDFSVRRNLTIEELTNPDEPIQSTNQVRSPT